MPPPVPVSCVEKYTLAPSEKNRYRQAIYRYLQIKPFSQGGEKTLKPLIEKAAHTMSDPADLINVAIEQLIVHHYTLPAYSTLDRLVNHIRTTIETRLYKQTTTTLSSAEQDVLANLLKRSIDQTRTPFAHLKTLPAKATLKQTYAWEKQLVWLEAILDPSPHLKALSPTKIAQFGTQAYQLNLSDMLDITTRSRQQTLLLCLLDQMQRRVRDQLTTMLLHRIRLMHENGKKKLRRLRDSHQTLLDQMVNTLGEIVDVANEPDDAQLGQYVRKILKTGGGVSQYEERIAQLTALQNNNYLPLLRPYCQRYRTLFYRLTDLLKIEAVAPDPTLTELLAFRLLLYNSRDEGQEAIMSETVPSFATPRWRAIIIHAQPTEEMPYFLLNRIDLEVCVFSYIADGLRNGDLYIVSSDQFADYRTQLVSWEQCETMLSSYCDAVNLPETATAFVADLREQLETKITTTSQIFSAQDNPLFYFDKEGNPRLRQASDTVQSPPPESDELQALLQSRLPPRHLLDLLTHVHQWSPFTRHFASPSGSDPKLQDATTFYLLTIFCYGCNLGPTQTVHHLRQPETASVSARSLGRLNKQHITADKLESALYDIINAYARFSLPYLWGQPDRSVPDGTHYELRPNNLLGEHHIRYGAYGGIAYHHISDTYIALFSHFIACGVWEAVYILDGLLRNESDLQPKTVHADTRGQSEVVFGLAYLLGISLMPRMKNWDKVTMYRPHAEMSDTFLQPWFTRVVNWDLIEAQWPLLMQVTLSIHTGKLLPSWLLQKLRSDNPKNKLYLALRELGRVRRTLFLLDYVADASLRSQIQAATTKIESYNLFSQWIFFGDEQIISSRDPVEQEKRIKYKDVIANAIMLHNVVDMTDVLHEMATEGHPITPEFVATLSPYITEHIRRFGEYVIDNASTPPALQPNKPFLIHETPSL